MFCSVLKIKAITIKIYIYLWTFIQALRVSDVLGEKQNHHQFTAMQSEAQQLLAKCPTL